MEEFKIICVSPCKAISNVFDIEIKKGEIFTTNYYEFNYGGSCSRLFRDGKIIGLFEKQNFLKLKDYRNKIIDHIIGNDED